MICKTWLAIIVVIIKASPLWINGLKCGDVEYDIVAFDIDKYMGIWYEYSHSQSFVFGKQCKCAFANYSTIINEENNINIQNYCQKNGKLEYIEAKATLDFNLKGRMNVKFSRYFPVVPYDVVYIDEGYRTVVIVSCSVHYYYYMMWILSRDRFPLVKEIERARESIPFKTDDHILMEHTCN